eukprot:2583942-Rhodomonas_salina.1
MGKGMVRGVRYCERVQWDGGWGIEEGHCTRYCDREGCYGRCGTKIGYGAMRGACCTDLGHGAMGGAVLSQSMWA